MFVQSALHQLKVAIDTSIYMLNQYSENDLKNTTDSLKTIII